MLKLASGLPSSPCRSTVSAIAGISYLIMVSLVPAFGLQHSEYKLAPRWVNFRTKTQQHSTLGAGSDHADGHARWSFVGKFWPFRILVWPKRSIPSVRVHRSDTRRRIASS